MPSSSWCTLLVVHFDVEHANFDRADEKAEQNDSVENDVGDYILVDEACIQENMANNSVSTTLSACLPATSSGDDREPGQGIRVDQRLRGRWKSTGH